jgi:hypothetical protein
MNKEAKIQNHRGWIKVTCDGKPADNTKQGLKNPEDENKCFILQKKKNLYNNPKKVRGLVETRLKG